MYEFDWEIAATIPEREIKKPPFVSELLKKRVSRVLWVKWKEHCVECAVPDCYSSCSLYQRRADGACQRFAFGIRRNRRFSGHFGFGADITFRRWAKLEANMAAYDSPLCFRPLPSPIVEWYFRLSPKWRSRVAGVCRRLFKAGSPKFDAFALECFSYEDDAFNLILEYFLAEDGVTRVPQFRTSFLVQPGPNHFTVPFELFGMSEFKGYLYVTPEESPINRRVVFTWLDFVAYRDSPELPKQPSIVAAAKVKCVAWDLDNTLWDGVLIESDEVRVREESMKLIRLLDERGVLQTIVSKNDHAVAVAKLRELGLEQYFICPAINWGPKSMSLQNIAKRLNLGIDSFAVIDDSAFERAEIGAALPQVRLYSDTQIEQLEARSEFAHPVTAESRNRRQMYGIEQERSVAMNSFAGPSVDFLRGCQLKAELFVPRSEEDIERCYELLQRSNQLNLSGNRYTRLQLAELLGNTDAIGIAVRCSDKFGNYGLVGFSTWKTHGEDMLLVDLVISCRIAQKGIEPAYFGAIANLRKTGRFLAALRSNDRNGPLRNALSDIGFVSNSDGGLAVDVTIVKSQDVVLTRTLGQEIDMFFKERGR